MKKISSRYSFNYNITLCCRLGQGAQALNKAIDSGDTDLIYHVILTLQVIHSVKNEWQIKYWYVYEREEGGGVGGEEEVYFFAFI